MPKQSTKIKITYKINHYICEEFLFFSDFNSMIMRDQFVKWLGKDNIPKMIDYYIAHPEKMPELISLCMDHEDGVDMRATWLLNHLVQKRPEMVTPYLAELVDYIEGGVHTGVKRHIMRIFEEVDIPEELEGKLYDLCIAFIMNPKLPVAVPAFAMSVGIKICQKYPELSSEFLEVCRSLSDSESPAIKVRLRRVIKALDK